MTVDEKGADMITIYFGKVCNFFPFEKGEKELQIGMIGLDGVFGKTPLNDEVLQKLIEDEGKGGHGPAAKLKNQGVMPPSIKNPEWQTPLRTGTTKYMK